MTSIRPIIPALFLVLLASYYSQNYAGILVSPLVVTLFYNVNLHSGSLGGIFMYFQVYGALNIYSSGEISVPNDDLNNVIEFLYNIWNLEYIDTWLLPYCLAKSLNTL